MTSKKKIQLVLDEEAQSTLATLQEATGAGSMAEVLRDALGVYNSLRDMLAAGDHRKLALVDRGAGEMQELLIPSLMRRRSPIVPGALSAMPQPPPGKEALQTPAKPPERIRQRPTVDP